MSLTLLAILAARTGTATAQVKPAPELEILPVFFGTDRGQVSAPGRISFGTEKSRKLTLGRSLVSLPKRRNSVTRPWALSIPQTNIIIYQEASDPRKSAVHAVAAMPVDQFLQMARERLAVSRDYKDGALLVVHGIGSTFDEAMVGAANFADSIGFDGALFAYSWPAAPNASGNVDYVRDVNSVSGAEPYLREFIDLIVRQTGTKRLNIIAQGVGNQPLLAALKSTLPFETGGAQLGEIVFLTPDVERDRFEFLSQEVKRAAGAAAPGMTLVTSNNDRALGLARRFSGLQPRAGDSPERGPLVVKGVDTIDISQSGTDEIFLTHAGYQEQPGPLSDIGQLMKTGVRPPDSRNMYFKRTSSDSGTYWKYLPPTTSSEPSLPDFPWPPPSPSAWYVIPDTLIRSKAGQSAMSHGDVSAKLSTALDIAGYTQKSFYLAPGGFALVTQVEKIRNDGLPDGNNRWLQSNAATEFTLAGYLQRLLVADPGRYRLIVFVISNLQFKMTGAEALDKKTAEALIRSGSYSLTSNLKSQGYSAEHSCIALVYEFAKTAKGEAEFVVPSPIPGKTHLERASLWPALEKTF